MTVYTATSLTSDETWNFTSLPALARLLDGNDYQLAHDEMSDPSTRTVVISRTDEHGHEVVARVRVPAEACQPTGGVLHGGSVHVSLGDLLPKVDQWAAEHNVTRAEAVRELVSNALEGARR